MRKTAEDIIIDKIFTFVGRILSIIIKPDMRKESITEITEKEIDLIKKKYEIEGVILDVDNTLRKNMKEITPCNQKWLDMIRKKLKVVVVSNGSDKSIKEYLKEKDIYYIAFANKPLKKNFEKACALLRLKPNQVLVIGDRNFYRCIYGKEIWSNNNSHRRCKR